MTREGGVSAPDWRREDVTPRRGRSAGRGSEGERRKKQSAEGEGDRCVCVLVLGEHVRRRTRADGERVPTWGTRDASGQQWANARREVATPFSFSFPLSIWGLCVYLLWEALSDNLVIV